MKKIIILIISLFFFIACEKEIIRFSRVDIPLPDTPILDEIKWIKVDNKAALDVETFKKWLLNEAKKKYYIEQLEGRIKENNKRVIRQNPLQ